MSNGVSKIKKMFVGFWNDNDGLTISELTIMCVLPLYLFVGVKLALDTELSNNQVDFFATLSYPILAAIAKQAVERIGWPKLGRRKNDELESYISPSCPPQPYLTQESVQYPVVTGNQVSSSQSTNPYGSPGI
jgi:hypothetical protein